MCLQPSAWPAQEGCGTAGLRGHVLLPHLASSHRQQPQPTADSQPVSATCVHRASQAPAAQGQPGWSHPAPVSDGNAGPCGVSPAPASPALQGRALGLRAQGKHLHPSPGVAAQLGWRKYSESTTPLPLPPGSASPPAVVPVSMALPRAAAASSSPATTCKRGRIFQAPPAPGSHPAGQAGSGERVRAGSPLLSLVTARVGAHGREVEHRGPWAGMGGGTESGKYPVWEPGIRALQPAAAWSGR